MIAHKMRKIYVSDFSRKRGVYLELYRCLTVTSTMSNSSRALALSSIPACLMPTVPPWVPRDGRRRHRLVLSTDEDDDDEAAQVNSRQSILRVRVPPLRQAGAGAAQTSFSALLPLRQWGYTW